MPLLPAFEEEEILEQYADGAYKKIDVDGVFVLHKKGVASIPSEIDHTFKDRLSWEKHYVPRLQWNNERLDKAEISRLLSDNDTRVRHTAVF
jgi:uroporphyrinogen decarboxylase